jgi:hypothetical protein
VDKVYTVTYLLIFDADIERSSYNNILMRL